MTHDNVHSMHAGLFARDGHLTMLTLDRFEVGELSTPQCETAIDHIESCETCANRLASMRTDAVGLEPPAHVQARATRSRSWVGTLAIAATVAAAAALLMMALPQPHPVERSVTDDPLLTASPYTTTAEIEGAALVSPALDMLILEEESGAHVADGERVPWDTALTLQVSPHESGYIAIVSATEVLDTEAADTDGSTARHTVQVLMPVTDLQARSGPHSLIVEHTSHTAHDVSDEQILAIYCEEPFELDDPFDPALPSLREDCTTVEYTLTRFGEVADS